MSAPLSFEAKLRMLASTDIVLQGFFGITYFRWFDRKLLPGYVQKGTCARVTRVSEAPQMYSQSLPLALEQIRIQIDCLDYEAESARGAAQAVKNFLSTVADFMNPNQFDSPPTDGTQFANYQLTRRSTIEPQMQPTVYCESQDFRCFNNPTVT